MRFDGMDAEEARAFAERWLPAWSGNRPELLASFYSDDACYSDPGLREGVRGREALLAYFAKLLGRNPDWVWSQRSSVPMQDGFLNCWHALRDGRIYANHVFFDRAELLTAWTRQGRGLVA
jgi:hypothetical protein